MTDPTTTPALPELRPVARHKAYYDELRAIDAQVGAALEAEARAIKFEGFTLWKAAGLALRYRLKMAALFTLLEDRDVIKAGTYDRIKDSNIVEGGVSRPFAPMRLLAQYMVAHGLPEAAPGCEEAR